MKLIMIFFLLWWLFIFIDAHLKKLVKTKHEYLFKEVDNWLVEGRRSQGFLTRCFYYYLYSGILWPLQSFFIVLVILALLLFM